MLVILLLLALFHREIRALCAPLSIRLWLWWHPRTVYGAKQARILTPLLAKAAGRPVLFTAQGLGVFARVCKDPQALGDVWLEGLLRAMLATGTQPHTIRLPRWGPGGTPTTRISNRQERGRPAASSASPSASSAGQGGPSPACLRPWPGRSSSSSSSSSVCPVRVEALRSRRAAAAAAAAMAAFAALAVCF
jgi:hypothetical protein